MKIEISTWQLLIIDALVFFFLLVFPNNLDPIPFGFGMTFLFFGENGIMDDFFLKHQNHKKRGEQTK